MGEDGGGGSAAFDGIETELTKEALLLYSGLLLLRFPFPLLGLRLAPAYKGMPVVLGLVVLGSTDEARESDCAPIPPPSSASAAVPPCCCCC